MDSLPDALRRLCSFEDIGIWLVENTPIIRANFSVIRRSESIPVGPGGEIMDAWYARESKDLRCGWTATMEWRVPETDIWSARNLVEALNMFTLSPLMIRERLGKNVLVNQKVTLLAENFPGMWLAQKLNGKVN